MSGASPLSHSLLAACNFDVISAGAPDIAKVHRNGGPTRERRVVNLLDALASVLISEEKDEAIAVGGSLPAQQNSFEILVASNGNENLPEIKSKLEEIWNFLVSVRRASRTSPELIGESIEENANKLRKIVYDHNWKKVTKRFGNFDLTGLQRFFDEVSRDDSGYIVDKPKQDNHLYILESERRAIKDLGELVKAISRYMAKLAEVDADKKRHAENRQLAVSYLVPIGGIASITEGELKGIGCFTKDRSHPSHNFFDRCDRILLALGYGRPFSLRQGIIQEFFRKVYKTERYITDLMRLIYSQSWGHILDRRLQVTVVRAEKAPLEYNVLRPEIRDLLGDNWDDYEQLWNAKKSHKSSDHIENVVPHCECTLLAHFVNNGDLESYHFIGTSKLSCTGCWLFFKACNEARAEVADEADRGAPFLTRGSHSKACIPWVVPPINDKRLSDEIERRFCEHLKARLVGLAVEVTDYKWTDSSSSGTYAFNKKASEFEDEPVDRIVKTLPP